MCQYASAHENDPKNNYLVAEDLRTIADTIDVLELEQELSDYDMGELRNAIETCRYGNAHWDDYDLCDEGTCTEK